MAIVTLTSSLGVFGSAAYASTAPAAVAELINPVVGSDNVGLSQPFRWSPSPTAAMYYLAVGSRAGIGDVFTTFVPASVSSVAIPPLPLDKPLWVRIWTEAPGTGWMHGKDISFTVAAARFIFPVIGSANVAMTQAFQWSTTPAADMHYLTVGSSAGAADMINSFVPAGKSSYANSSLPHGQTLWARIWTEMPGFGWYHAQDVSFSMA